MILSEMRDYLRDRGQATLEDIALHFDSDPEAVRGMLELWVRKGKVERSTLTPDCGGSCKQCGMAGMAVYRWLS